MKQSATAIHYFLMIVLWSELTALKKNYRVEDLWRHRRYLVFPNPLNSETKVQVLFGLGLPMEGAVSTIIGYVLKCNYKLPYNSSDFTQPYVRYQRNIHDNKHNKHDQSPLSRWELYRLLESALQTLGSGKACLLRAICESAQTPFDTRHGLLGELLHIILTPSTTSEETDLYEDQEYYAAEYIGRFYEGACAYSFYECSLDPLSYFSVYY